MFGSGQQWVQLGRPGHCALAALLTSRNVMVTTWVWSRVNAAVVSITATRLPTGSITAWRSAGRAGVRRRGHLPALVRVIGQMVLLDQLKDIV